MARLRALGLIVCFVLGARTAAQAQQAGAAPDTLPRGRIAGRVLDQGTGKPIPGARVTTTGAPGYADSDMDGRFRTGWVPAGKASIRVAAIGYRASQLDSITVRAGEAVVVNVALGSAPVELEELVVTSDKPIQASSDAGLLALQAAAPAASDGISAETIAKSPDSDAGDAVARIPGVTVVDDKSVVVRGLQERYTNTLFNGVEVASPEPLKRSVPLDIFDANLLESIVTSKAATPDRPGDFAGGSVEIRTKEFPDNFTASISTSAEWNSATTFQPAASGPRTFSDFLGFDDGMRAQPTTQLSDSVFIPTPGSDAAVLAEQFGEEIRNVWTPRTSSALPNGSVSANVGGQVAPGSTTPLGYVAAVNYSNSRQTVRDRLYRMAESGIDPAFPFSVDNRYDATETSVEWTVMGNLTQKLGPSSKIGLKNLYTRGTEETFLQGSGFQSEYQQNPNRRFYQARYIERSALQSQLSGEHYIPSLNGLRAGWVLTYSEARRDEPENRELNYYRQPDGTYIAAGRDDKFQFRYFRDQSYVGQLDLGLPLTLHDPRDTEVKVGGLYRERPRSFRTTFYETAQFQSFSPDPSLLMLPPEELWAPEIIGQQFTFRRRNASDLAPYEADDDLTAAYVMGDVALPHGIRFVGGLRMEDWRLTVFVPDRATAVPPEYRRNRDWLWSGNLKIPVGERMNVRVAGFSAVARPDVREITNGVYFPVSGECGFRGNPRLQRSLIYNADLKWEFFPSATEIVSVSGYYKHFNAPIVSVASGNAGSRCEFSVTNALSAEVTGAELEVRKNLIGPLSGSINVALVHSKARLDPNDPFFGVIADSLSPPLQNQSPYILNASLSWDDAKGGFNAAVFVNLFGDRISDYGASGRSGDQAFIIPDRIEQGRFTLDAKVRKSLGSRLGITLAGQNLTNNQVTITQELSGVTWIVGQYRKGINVSLGVTYGF